MSERTQHFREGYARMLYEDLYPMFNNLFIEEADTEYRNAQFRAKQTRQAIQDYLAERAYDLLVHDRMHTGTVDLQVADSSLEAEEMVSNVPDLTAWPEYS